MTHQGFFPFWYKVTMPWKREICYNETKGSFPEKAGIPAFSVRGSGRETIQMLKRKGYNMKFRKALAFVLSACMIVGLLGACGDTGSGEGPTPPAQNNSQNSGAPEDNTPPEGGDPAPAPAGSFTWNGQKEVWSILPTTGAEGLIWINDTMGAIMQAEGFTYVKKDAQGQPVNQVQFVQDAIVAGNVGALMIAAMDVGMLKDVVEEAMSKGIAVAMLGAEPTDYAISGCVYTAYEITGMWAVLAAENWVTERVAEGGNVPANADGKYEVFCDIYTNITDGVYRSNGIVGTVDASDVLVRVADGTSYGDAAMTDAYNNAQTALSAHPDLRIFIAYEPEPAMGMANAIRDYCETNGLDMADFCVISCYGEDTTFSGMYEESVANHSANPIKGYSTYGDPAIPYGDEAAAQVGASYEALAAFSKQLNGEEVPVIIPPLLTGEHLADILLAACGFDAYDFEPGVGNTFYDTITVCNVYGYSDTWVRTDANPAIQYKDPTYIG